jgi:Tol biopolymer transport system component/imidazolonepropionase-like amidohydrolase
MLHTASVWRGLLALVVTLASLTLMANTHAFTAKFSALAQDEKQDGKKDEKKDEGLPLKPAGKISFSTDEGTWMSLDLSPDGQTIVFDLAGDIYTLPVGGGEAKRIVGGDLGFESQPKFSPDGKLIAFISDRSGGENLYVCKPDGSDIKPITKGRGTDITYYLSPSWTPDGSYLIASRADRGISTYHPYMWHKDGGTGVSIGTPPPPPPTPGQPAPAAPQLNKMGAAASPDGKYIYWAQRTGAFNYNAQFPIWQIYHFDRNTSETVRLTNAQGSAMRPVLSPDGKQLVYATRYQLQTALRVRDLETNEERWLISHVTRDDQESRATRDTFPGYAFTPDGKALIVTIDGKIKRVDFASGAATTIPFTAKVDVDIAARLHFDYKVDDGPTVKARLIRYPALSPDGKRLAFSAFNKLYVMDAAAGAKPQRLTNQTAGEFMPAWSPDGRYIAFTTWTREGGHLYRVASGGGQPEQLTRRPAYYSYPCYSPDNSKIVFTYGAVTDQLFADLRDEHAFNSPEEAALHGQPDAEVTGANPTGIRDLRYIPATGGDAVLIAAAEGGQLPHFSNDAQRVYFTTRQGLSSVRLDGLDKRVHLKVTGTGTPPQQALADEIRISPDGARAFVSLQTRHFLVTIPKAGKETVNVSITNAPTSSVPVKKLSAEGGDYLQWTPDGQAVTWSWGTKFFKQAIDADKPETFDALVEAPRAKPAGKIILTGARIITMKGNEVLERGDLTIVDNRIVEIKASAPLPTGKNAKKKTDAPAFPADAKVIDVSGKTIMPGLVDVHAHMWPPRDVHQTQVWQYLTNLAYGVTTTRDPQSSTTDVYAYADLVETGEIAGPRIFTTGPGVFSGDGLGDKEAARNYIKRYREAYQTDTLKEYVTGDRLVRQWVALACQEFKITPTTEGALDMKLDLTQMMDGFSGNEHALPIQPLYKDMAEFVAQTKTFYTPTILVAYGAPWTENYFFQNTDVLNNKKLARFIPAELLNSMLRRRGQWFHPDEYGFKGIAEGAAKIVRAGGRVGLGGHGQMQGIGCHWELWALQSGGMTTLQALQVATIFGAEAIGLSRDVGSLEPDKLADLIVLDQNPLTDIHNTNTIRYVMKNGELFEGDTLDQVWPVQKKLEKQYWWEREPK